MQSRGNCKSCFKKSSFQTRSFKNGFFELFFHFGRGQLALRDLTIFCSNGSICKRNEHCLEISLFLQTTFCLMEKQCRMQDFRQKFQKFRSDSRSVLSARKGTIWTNLQPSERELHRHKSKLQKKISLKKLLVLKAS